MSTELIIISVSFLCLATTLCQVFLWCRYYIWQHEANVSSLIILYALIYAKSQLKIISYYLVMTFSEFLRELRSYISSASRTIIIITRNLLTFAGVVFSIGLFASGGLYLYQIALREEIFPDINGPVSRFITNIDFENRTVELDSTISKSLFGDMEITLWRLGDGTTIKSTENEVNKNEILSHTYDKPGTYQISYSIIDSNDLSDEAFCTVIFDTEEVAESNGEKVLKNVGYVDNYAGGTDCGKSYSGYNQQGGIYAINATREDTREALFMIGSGAGLLLSVFAMNVIINLIYVRGKRKQK